MAPYTVDKETYMSRWPDFLVQLTDSKYCNVYEKLVGNPDLKLPMWKDFTSLDTGPLKVTASILHHVMT